MAWRKRLLARICDGARKKNKWLSSVIGAVNFASNPVRNYKCKPRFIFEVFNNARIPGTPPAIATIIDKIASQLSTRNLSITSMIRDEL